MLDVVRRTADFGLDGILLDTVMMPSLDREFVVRLAQMLDETGLDRDVSWGSPNGLNVGRDPRAVEDLLAHIQMMEAYGSRILRIVGGSKRTADVPHGPALERLANVIGEECLPAAEQAGVVLGFENHWDYSAEEVLGLIKKVDSPHFRVTYDTGNALRVGDDPLEGAKLLAPFVVATNLKDIGHPIVETSDWRGEFPCVPFGHGRMNIAQICRVLVENGEDPMMAIEVDRPREDWMSEDEYIRECASYLRGVRDMLQADAGNRPTE